MCWVFARWGSWGNMRRSRGTRWGVYDGLDPATDQAITGLELVNATATGIYHNTTATQIGTFPICYFVAETSSQRMSEIA